MEQLRAEKVQRNLREASCCNCLAFVFAFFISLSPYYLYSYGTVYRVGDSASVQIATAASQGSFVLSSILDCPHTKLRIKHILLFLKQFQVTRPQFTYVVKKSRTGKQGRKYIPLGKSLSEAPVVLRKPVKKPASTKAHQKEMQIHYK